MSIRPIIFCHTPFICSNFGCLDRWPVCRLNTLHQEISFVAHWGKSLGFEENVELSRVDGPARNSLDSVVNRKDISDQLISWKSKLTNLSKI